MLARVAGFLDKQLPTAISAQAQDTTARRPKCSQTFVARAIGRFRGRIENAIAAEREGRRRAVKRGLKLVERPITNLVYKYCYGVDGYGFGICEVCRGSDLGHIPNHTDRRDALRSTVLAQSSSLPASDWGLLRESFRR